MKRELNVRSIFKLIITFSCIELIGDFISVPNFPVVKTWIGKVNEIEIFYQGKQVAMMNEDEDKMLTCMKNQFFYPVTIGKNVEDELVLVVCKDKEEFEGRIYYDEKQEVFFTEGLFINVGTRPVNKELITVLNQYLDKTF